MATLLTQINEEAQEHQLYISRIAEAIGWLGFNRDEVIVTEQQYEDFLARTAKRPLLVETYAERGAAMGRAAELDWLADLKDQREKEGAAYAEKKTLGLDKPNTKVPPSEGQRVILPGQAGLGVIVALDLEHGQLMIKDKKGREFVVKTEELVGPKVVGNQATWMIKR